MQPFQASLSGKCLPSLFTRLYRVTSSSFTGTIQWSRVERMRFWLQLLLSPPALCFRVSAMQTSKSQPGKIFGARGLEVNVLWE